jgi:SAM-dependent methyltransferase
MTHRKNRVPPSVVKKALSTQRQQWQDTFSEIPEMFGPEPSDPARKTLELLKRKGITRLLELGCGQGRDTIYFAQNGFTVYALDYSALGLEAINKKAQELGLSHLIATITHNVRNALPFADETFDACYSHMLFCMALTNSELVFLAQEIRRVLKPDGLNIYTVRHTGDPYYGIGIYRGEDMYEVEDFIVHFFNMEQVQKLAKGYEIVDVDEFEEGPLPRKLYQVTLRKTSQ